MADIELVVKIPEEIINDIDDKNYQNVISWYDTTLFCAIKNGTPLPKGHGDLKDTEELKKAFVAWSMAVHGNFTDADIASIIYNSPTIIKADKDKEVNVDADSN